MLETMVQKKIIRNDVFVWLLTLTILIREEDKKLTQILFLYMFAVPYGGS